MTLALVGIFACVGEKVEGDSAVPGETAETGSVDSVPTCADADGDGHADAACGGDDCDDTQDTVHPGAEEAWVTTSLGFGSGAAGLDLARLADGTLHLVWWRASDGSVHYATDSSGAWVDEEVATGAGCCDVRIAAVDTELVLAWSADGVAVARGSAGAWSPETLWSEGAPISQYLDLTVVAGTDPVLTFTRDDHIWVARAGTDGWEEDDLGTGSFAVAVAARADGTLEVLHTRVVGPDQWRRMAQSDATGSWVSEELGTLNSYTGLRATAVGDRVVAAWNVPLEISSGLALASSEAGVWTQTFPLGSDGPDVSPDLDVAIGADGGARVVFADQRTGDLILVDDGGGWTPRTLASAVTVGPALELDGSDAPIVAYGDRTGLVITSPGSDGVDQDCDGAD